MPAPNRVIVDRASPSLLLRYLLSVHFKLQGLQKKDEPLVDEGFKTMERLMSNDEQCGFIDIWVDLAVDQQYTDYSIRGVPKFILGQLETQGLTETDSGEVRIPVVVSTFVLGHLDAWGYPALFVWHQTRPSKKCCVFAFLDYPIMTRRHMYDLSELMSLRNSFPDPAKLLEAADNGDIAEIIRLPGLQPTPASATQSKPSSTQNKDDSPIVSEEASSNKGTINRRMGRTLAREASQNSMLAAAWDSARDTPQQTSNDLSRSMEWKYRGRSEIEMGTSEPTPAPTGIAAQRDEGFQRFYKAVVSPTHVRVTAGGRIVPNMRGPPSPTSKKTSDTPTMDSQRVSDTSTSKAGPTPVGVAQPVPVMPQFVPGFPPGFQPLQAPVSFVPMALPPGLPFAPPTVNPAAMIQPAPNNPKPADDNGQTKAKPAAPEPFFYNGQIVYPMGAFPTSMVNPMLPVQMVGIPHGGIAPQVPRHFVQSQPPRPSTTDSGVSHSSATRNLSGIPPILANVVPANANFNGASAPPISSIKPSDITKKQIAAFKQNLKYHEDQLQYNRHQIDEKEMEQKIQIIKGHIQRFEATLQTQLEYEAAHAKAMKAKEDGKASEESRPQQQHQQQPSPEKVEEVKNRMKAHIQRYKTSEESRTQQQQPAGTGNRGSGESAVSDPSGPSKTTSLPSDAALAPAFQPRGYASTWTSSKYVKEMKAYGQAEKRLLAMESKSMGQMHTGDQRSASQPFTASTGPAGKAERKTNNSDNSSRGGGSKQNSNFGVPYLLGTLPRGVNPRTAKSQDYVYMRPLTEEEMRARFLYWGKAPNIVTKGLPKFDGKHFYPPSPVKETSVGVSRVDDCRVCDSDSDPFRSATPVARAGLKGKSASEDNRETNRHSRALSFETQVNVGAEKTTGDVQPKGLQELVNEHVEAVEPRSENAGPKIWQGVLKKDPTSSVSSTTAQGLLPQYTGTAAASLSPSLSTNQQPAAKDVCSRKVSESFDPENASMLPIVPEKRSENCPPVSSLEDQFRHLTLDVAGHRNVTSTFNM
ncbi:hypothetical protein VTJ49DRAFT_2951 [Mycothermus thermophilus]|uniref:Uncharacterized protein n=1 Tax=Humicola insolens TaxID=85995 RepID=A0ABR3V8P0_HUMIN